MSQAIQILKVLEQHGTSTYDDVEARTKIPRNKLRWAMNDLKSRKLVVQTEDAMAVGIAWKITLDGRRFIAGNDAEAKPTKAKAKAEKKAPVAQSTVATEPGKGEATPAAGGECNSGSNASDSLVEADSASTEGVAVVETRAGNEPEAQHPAEPVVSDEKITIGPDAGPLIASMGMNGNLLMQNAQGEFYLPAHQVRELGHFMINTFEVWNKP